MATKEEKKQVIRDMVVKAARIYSSELAGKTFLYVYGNDYFEVSFPVESFLHLTGVGVKLSAKEFYKNAKNAKLSTGQFYFDKDHIFANAKKKLPCLIRLPELTNNLVFILKDLKTSSAVYMISIANLEFTLGLTENVAKDGFRKNNYYIPKTLRVRDSAISKSGGGEVVDFILKKDARIKKYNEIMVKDDRKHIPISIHYLVEDWLLNEIM